MYTAALEAQDRKARQQSAIATTIIVLVALLLCLLWRGLRMGVPPAVGEKYEMLGRIDFGDMNIGSQNINNFEEAVENPTESSSSSEPEPTETTPAEADPTPPDPVVTTTKPQETSTPEPTKPTKPKPTKPKPTKPEPTKPTKPEPTKPEPTKPKPTNTNDNKPTNDNGQSGSNHGDGGDVGNQGTPNTTILDPDGLYSFGTGGGGGLKGRQPLSLDKPRYSVQEEGVLTFEFFIGRDGKVLYVKALPNNKPGLAAAGKAAIKKWKFSKVGSSGPERQKVRVSITFKLKN